jgi:CBS domain-containing membrane protein
VNSSEDATHTETITFASRVVDWLRAFRPSAIAVNASERWRAIVGAAVGVLFAALLSQFFATGSAGLWLAAPLGASAVLVFAVPASPLAQPWSVVGGNTLSALIGIACARWIGDVNVAAALAVSMAIAVMFFARCLHPPGGAVALTAVLTHASHWSFASFPVFTNSALLVAAAIAYNTGTGRRYPHVQVQPRGAARASSRFSSADLDEVLARYNQVLDVSRDDLEDILHAAEMQAMRRRLGDIRCADVMSRDPIVVEYATDLQDAWAQMRRHRIKALPVVDRQRRLLGIVTLADFMRHADLDLHEGIRARLQALIRRTESVYSSKPEVVGQIMTAQVRVASADRHVLDLIPLFSEAGHHHIPIIGADNRLVGIITQSDFVRALFNGESALRS